MVQIDLQYEGNLRCTATHKPSGQQIKTDAPVDNHGKGEFFSPTDLLAASLGTCMMTIIGIMGEKLGVDVSGMTGSVVKEMASAPARRVGKLTLVIRIPQDIAPEQRKQIENAAHACPAGKSLHPDIVEDIQFIYGK